MSKNKKHVPDKIMQEVFEDWLGMFGVPISYHGEKSSEVIDIEHEEIKVEENKLYE